jgi:hypothetical protein
MDQAYPLDPGRDFTINISACFIHIASWWPRESRFPGWTGYGHSICVLLVFLELMFWDASLMLITGSDDRGYPWDSLWNILYPITDRVFSGLFGSVRQIGPTNSVIGLLKLWGIIISPTLISFCTLDLPFTIVLMYVTFQLLHASIPMMA